MSIEKVDGLLTKKYPEIFNLMIAMISTQKKVRPHCKDILEKRNHWSLGLDEIINENNRNEILNEPSSIEESFHKYFIHKKFMFKQS
jgi:hypothetical protein